VTRENVWNMYSLDDDIQLGQSALQANTAEMQRSDVPINADPQRVAQLNEIVSRIAAASDLPQLPYTVTLYQTNIVNAAAAPGGSMMVFEGLYDPEEGLVDPNDEDELAAVMAHEIAHVNCRHVTERLTRISSAAILTEVVAAVAQSQGQKDVADIARGVFVGGAAIIVPMYSRKDEAEADRVGLFYMAKAGYDPRAAARLWKKAAEHKGDKESTSIFSTHPADENRHKALMKLMPYAMEEYARSTGGYPPDYRPAESLPDPETFDWRVP
jgi:predicted Zn-dependent protease